MPRSLDRLHSPWRSGVDTVDTSTQPFRSPLPCAEESGSEGEEGLDPEDTVEDTAEASFPWRHFFVVVVVGHQVPVCEASVPTKSDEAEGRGTAQGKRQWSDAIQECDVKT